jgi:tetraacyldisaccharide 4'-kinase
VPVVVGENRYEAARLAVERFGASVVVLDDGFQHRSLVKDVEIVLARARKPWGNGLLVPAGPLREPVRALGRADLIVATAVAEDDGEPVRAAARQHAPEVPVLVADHEPTEYWTADRSIVEPATALAHRRLLAFAGIARPDAFRGTLERLGVRLAELVEFPDHFRYRRQDLDMLSTRADVTGATGLITTEKDWVRLGGRWPAPSRLYVLGVRFALRSGEDVWREVLGRALRPHRGRDIGALT